MTKLKIFNLIIDSLSARDSSAIDLATQIPDGSNAVGGRVCAGCFLSGFIRVAKKESVGLLRYATDA